MPRSPKTIRDLFEAFAHTVGFGERRPVSMTHTLSSLSRCVKEDAQLANLNEDTATRIIKDLRDVHGLAPQTIMRQMARWKKPFAWGAKKGWVRESFLKALVVNDKPLPKHRQAVQSGYVTTLMEAFQAFEPLDLGAHLALYAGHRKSEALAQRMHDVDFRRNKLSIVSIPEIGFHTKNGRPRVIPMHKMLRARLERITDGRVYIVKPVHERRMNLKWAAMGLAEHYSQTGGNSNIDVRLRGIMKALGFPGGQWAWHCLRHTFATSCIEAGLSVRVLQRILGHSSLETTEKYLDMASGRDMQEGIAKLDYEAAAIADGYDELDVDDDESLVSFRPAEGLDRG